MSGNQIKASRRELRKAFGKDSVDVINALVRMSQAHSRLLSRGFWGRLRWLVFGV